MFIVDFAVTCFVLFFFIYERIMVYFNIYQLKFAKKSIVTNVISYFIDKTLASMALAEFARWIPDT